MTETPLGTTVAPGTSLPGPGRWPGEPRPAGSAPPPVPALRNPRGPRLRVRAFEAALAGIVAAVGADGASGATIDVPSPQAPTITIAINIAAPGDEIVVGPGTYFESISLGGKALTLRSGRGPEVTVIDGLGQFESVVRITSGEGASTLIEGFAIRNGQATGAAPNDRGGGIYCNLTSPTIRDCIFQDNVAVVGGAFYANGGAPSIERCLFLGNDAVSASGDGGAIYGNNTTLPLTDCDFVGNQAVRFGGAIRSAGGTTMTLHRCAFDANGAGSNGGVIDVGSAALAHLFRDCRFTGNSSGAVGGAVQLANGTAAVHQFLNCLFVANEAATGGGAVHAGANALLVNCTMVQNSAASGGAILASTSATATVRNSIVWNNAPNGLAGSGIVASWTCHQAPLAGEGNLSEDPLLANLPEGDLRLSEASPCIDAGNTTLLPATVSADLDGLTRATNVLESPAGVAAYGYFIDMGVFEYPEPAPPPACPGDVNQDGTVDGADLGLLLGAWGLCP